MTQFATSQKRAFWVAIAVSLGTDLLIGYGITSMLGFGSTALGIALVGTIAFEIALTAYALLNFLRRLAWYFLFEKEGRIRALHNEFLARRMPDPQAFYGDPDEYLIDVLKSRGTSPQARELAGALLGAMLAQRMHGPRAEAIATAITVEAVIGMLPMLSDEQGDESGPSLSEILDDDADWPPRQKR